jgi:hypothetical protein
MLVVEEPAPVYIPVKKGETRFEHLPKNLQLRLLEMALRPFDPMRLPRPQRLPILRGFIGSLLGGALLPGVLYPQAVGFFIAVASLTGVSVTFVLERVAAKLPSFWYIHPSFLIGYHFGTIEVFPFAGLVSANSYEDKKLSLCFQSIEENVEVFCEGADELAVVIRHFAAVARQHLEQNNPQAMLEVELFPHHIW